MSDTKTISRIILKKNIFFLCLDRGPPPSRDPRDPRGGPPMHEPPRGGPGGPAGRDGCLLYTSPSPRDS